MIKTTVHNTLFESQTKDGAFGWKRLCETGADFDVLLALIFLFSIFYIKIDLNEI